MPSFGWIHKPECREYVSKGLQQGLETVKLLRKEKNNLYCLRVITSLAAGTETAVTQR